MTQIAPTACVVMVDIGNDDGAKPLAVYLDRSEAERFMAENNAVVEVERKVLMDHTRRGVDLMFEYMLKNNLGKVPQEWMRPQLEEAARAAGPAPARTRSMVTIVEVPLASAGQSMRLDQEAA